MQPTVLRDTRPRNSLISLIKSCAMKQNSLQEGPRIRPCFCPDGPAPIQVAAFNLEKICGVKRVVNTRYLCDNTYHTVQLIHTMAKRR